MTEAILKARLVKIGFTEDYQPSFNVLTNANDLMDWIKFGNTPEDHKDLIWLCNQLARANQREPDMRDCQDNFRACRKVGVGKRAWSEAYQRARDQGCCGYFDQYFKNPVTGNEFYIGFNFGH